MHSRAGIPHEDLTMSRSLRVALVVALATAPGGPVAADDAGGIDGRWSVTSVELAGEAVPGLDGAELVLDGGKKVFTLPGGKVEKGTYTLDPGKRPRQIDATTEGRDGTEAGIYAVEGDTLKLCLATQGGARPKAFATKKGTDHLLIVLRRARAGRGDPPAAKTPTGERAFRMGFTGFVYDITPAAVADSRKFVRENGDLLAHHIEGVPWAEAVSGKPFPRAVLDEWEGKRAATPPRGKVYLAVSPGRGDLKVADKAGPLPGELAGKAYDDPAVMTAYLNYCRRAVAFFKPDYLAIGIEVNEIHDRGAKAWQAYVTLHRHVYAGLKKDHPGMPVFASWTLHNMFKTRGAMLEGWKALMPHNDLVAVSYYPFFVPDRDRLAALDWMTGEFDGFKKPYAVVETNDAAERLPLPSVKVVIEGTPAKQEAYYRTLLGLAHKRDFAFVVSFVHQDYDALWGRIKASSPELFVAWKDCGLLDEKGKARPAYRVWKDYFDLPLRK
jgi:uncharacterized protein (TIGR03067 family)